MKARLDDAPTAAAPPPDPPDDLASFNRAKSAESNLQSLLSSKDEHHCHNNDQKGEKERDEQAT